MNIFTFTDLFQSLPEVSTAKTNKAGEVAQQKSQPQPEKPKKAQKRKSSSTMGQETTAIATAAYNTESVSSVSFANIIISLNTPWWEAR